MSARCTHCGRTFDDKVAECPSCGSHQIERTGGAPGSGPAKRGGSTGLIAGVAIVAVVVPMVGLLAMVGLSMAGVFLAGSPQPAPSAVAAPSDGFAGVKAAGVLRVAADPNAPPFLSGQPGAWEGFEYALAAALADSAGAKLEIVPSDFDGLAGLVRDGAADLAIGQVPPRPTPGLAFTRSYLQYTLCLVVAPVSPVTSLDALRTKTIGTYDDPAVKEIVDAALGRDWTQRRYSDYGYFDDLAAGRLDAVVYDCPLVRYELGKATGPAASLKVVDDALGVATYSVAVSAKRPELRADVDRVLGELGNTGLLQQLAARWLREGAPTTAAETRFTVVGSGETLDDVAARALGDKARAAELLRWNTDILGGDPKAAYAGMRLRLR